jgi:predicted RNA-binding Zn-ribbon protein involved in translation (DUF1610 family)
MDINCPTCGEQWDAYHMRHDEPHEWGLSDLELKDILSTGRFNGPNDRIREAARAVGWEFATNSVMSFTRCPSCAKSRPLFDAQARKERTTVLAELLDGDEDAMATYSAAD